MSEQIMYSNGFACTLNMPQALKSNQQNDNELAHGLPPYSPRNCYLVDKYPACPDNWMKSEGKLTSYFVPVKEKHGMWLDLNSNFNHTHHVAIVISIQGINPITGLPCSDYQMEQYIEKCPKHKIKFGPNRYCEKCNFKWPKQNYICTTGTPSGQLWLDGFRAVDGIVRQYILTKEKMKGVASNIIGNKKVYAIGISFFISKEQKPSTTVIEKRYNYNWTYSNYSPYFYPYKLNDFDYTIGGTVGDNYYPCDDNTNIVGDSPYKCDAINNITKNLTSCNIGNDLCRNSKQNNKTFNKNFNKKINPKINMEIGAGAKINQLIYDDTENLDFWNDNPESIITINYCDEIDAKQIIEQGEIDIEGSKEGFLQEIPTGN